MTTDTDIAFGELRGFLAAFSQFNNKADHGCTFTLDRLPQAENVSKAIDIFFGGEATKVAVTPLDDWQQTVRALLTMWLFQFQVVGKDLLVDHSKSFSLSYDFGRKSVLDWIMERLEKVVQPTAVWKVEVATKGFYECAWDDVAFEGAVGTYLLHLGVSD